MDDLDAFNGVDAQELCDRGSRVREDTEFCARLITAQKRVEDVENEHVEERLYERFISPADQNRMLLFHRATDWRDRVLIVENFEDDRLVELGRRLIFYHRPDALPIEQQSAHRRFVAMRLLGHGYLTVPWLTALDADEEAVGLLEGCTEDERLIIGGARSYFSQRIDEARAWLQQL